jgi:GNAT superfamily N-acetyltransferase
MRIATEEKHVVVDTDKRRLDLDVIRGFLSTSYWSPGIPRDTVQRAIDNSLCFGAYVGDRQVGFARVITDLATFAYLADVFVIQAFRGRGLSKRLMDAIVAHPDLQGLRRWMLATRDAHTLYSRYGFTALASADQFMELHNTNVYEKRRNCAWYLLWS